MYGVRGVPLKNRMNSELKKVEVWCDKNKLSINFAKTNFMIIKSTKKKNQGMASNININAFKNFSQ